jgi:effector-binding domain-containing protein
MDYTVETRQLRAQPTAARRAVLTAGEVGPWISRTYSEIAAYLRRIGVAMSGPPYARHEFVDGSMDIEAGFPVATPVLGEGLIRPSGLPGGIAAVTTHYGPYETVPGAYEATAAWLREQGLKGATGHWEVYYTDPVEEPDSARWRTDVVVPYTRELVQAHAANS